MAKSHRAYVLQMLAAVSENTKLLFICSPGNPTCKAIPLSDIEQVASATNQYKGLVVVDEAYVDFSSAGSAVELIQKYPNVVVLQTLSKAFGLAGIRCGFCLGSPDVIQLMNNVKAPYNVNSLTSEVALNAMKSISILEQNIAGILEQRILVAEQLQALDFVVKVYPSDSNFLLFRVPHKANDLYKTMADAGVVTRFRGTELHCHECIRVTIGTPEENVQFLELLQKTWKDLNP
jgi:histidinol-phosphate aminotransferase